jgi:arsenate reductase
MSPTAPIARRAHARRAVHAANKSVAARRIKIRRATFIFGETMSDKPLILVLCTGNSARSQMAEGFLRKYKSGKFSAASAGTQPKTEIHPLTISAMNEIGIDLSNQRPKDVSEFLGKVAVRHILIVCDRANQSCPRIWPGSFSRTFMPFDDPAAATGTDAEKLEVFRRVRDEIDAAMKRWNPDLPQENR